MSRASLKKKIALKIRVNTAFRASKKFIRNDRLNENNRDRSINLFHPFSSHQSRVEITQYHCTRSKHARNHNPTSRSRKKSIFDSKRGKTTFCLRRVNALVVSPCLFSTPLYGQQSVRY